MKLGSKLIIIALIALIIIAGAIALYLEFGYKKSADFQKGLVQTKIIQLIDILESKKELPQEKREVSLFGADSNSSLQKPEKSNPPLSLNQDVYFWDESKSNFSKASTEIIYNPSLNIPDHPLKKESADLNNNSYPENFCLENGQLTVTENLQKIWQSPKDWQIDDFILADSTNDGIIDINLSVWKAGNFGSSKPFWVKDNDMSVKNHFFVLNFKNGKIMPVWQSSNLDRPNQEMVIADIDNDNKNDLVVIEGDYSKEEKCKKNFVAVWKWNEWGFSNEWRSEMENFCNLKIEKNNGKSYIIVNSFSF